MCAHLRPQSTVIRPRDAPIMQRYVTRYKKRASPREISDACLVVSDRHGSVPHKINTANLDPLFTESLEYNEGTTPSRREILRTSQPDGLRSPWHIRMITDRVRSWWSVHLPLPDATASEPLTQPRCTTPTWEISYASPVVPDRRGGVRTNKANFESLGHETLDNDARTTSSRRAVHQDRWAQIAEAPRDRRVRPR